MGLAQEAWKFLIQIFLVYVNQVEPIPFGPVGMASCFENILKIFNKEKGLIGFFLRFVFIVCSDMEKYPDRFSRFSIFVSTF